MIQDLHIQLFRIRCLDENDEAQDNCKLSLKLRLKEGKEYNGGHEHTEGNRPLGKLTIDGTEYENEDIKVPIKKEEKGTKIVYDAPEVSGVVELEFKVYDVDDIIITKGVTNTTFTVRIVEDLVPINIRGLVYEINSHPEDGFYLEPSSHDIMLKIVNAFTRGMHDPFQVSRLPMITLETEGASLKWGGLFDINKNWQSGHKQHRAGDDIDLSMSVFNKLSPEDKESALRLLDQSIKFYALGNPIYAPGEGPRKYKDHWHVNLK